MLTYVACFVFFATAFMMLWNGFLRHPGRKLSWPMFIRHASVDVRLTGIRKAGGWREDINVYELFPAGEEFMITSMELEEILEFLGETYESISGEGIIRFADGTESIRVTDGVLAVGGDHIGVL